MASFDATGLSERAADMSNNTDHRDTLSPLLRPTVHQDSDIFAPLNQSSPIRSSSSHTRMGMPPSPGDALMLQNENRMLKEKLRQLQADFQTEQGMVAQLRQRMNTVEHDKLDTQAKANQEIIKAQGEAAKLRAQLERGEAVRQNIEYELAKSRKDVSQEKMSASQKENLLSEMNENLKEKIGDMTVQIEQLRNQLSDSRNASENEAKRLRMVIEEKQQMINTYRAEQSALESEREKQDLMLQQKDSVITDVEEKLKDSEDSYRKQSDMLKQQMHDYEFSREREERMKTDLENAMSRVRTLEESIEAERAAHLETKFNSEIVQLRIRDLEGALDLERNSKVEAMTTSETLSNQLRVMTQNVKREIQELYEEERKISNDSREKLAKTEHEHRSIIDQLHMELDGKKTVIQKMADELEIHQKNFDELKKELSIAKKRQSQLEKTYGDGMRELELTLDNFIVESKIKRKRKVEFKQSQQVPTPAHVLEVLRQTLLDQKEKHDKANAEVTKIRSRCDALSKECESYKNMILSKEKTLESSQKETGRNQKELRRLQNEISELQNTVAKLRSDLQSARKSMEKEHQLSCNMNAEIAKLTKEKGIEIKLHLDYLHTLYQRMFVGHAMPRSQGGQVGNFTWDNMTAMIDDQLMTLLSAVEHSSQKVDHLETLVAGKDKAIDELQKVYEEQLERLAGVAQEHSSAWQQQKAELEKHYSKMLSEIHARHQRTQALADQAWEKLRTTGDVQQGLEKECTQMVGRLAKYQTENNCLLAGCALLSGALYSAYLRISALNSQRHLLESQQKKYARYNDQLLQVFQKLPEVKGSPLSPRPGDTSATKRSPLLSFRIGAVAVLAANRLAHFGRYSHRALTLHNAFAQGSSIGVLVGRPEQNDMIFSGISGQRMGSNGQDVPKLTEAWLHNQELLSLSVTALAETDTNETADSQQTVIVARRCFQKLLNQLTKYFPTQPADVTAGFREKGSLIKLLGRGLKRAISQTKQPLILSTDSLMAKLRDQVLQYLKYIQSMEAQNKRLQDELSARKSDSPASQDVINLLQNELQELKEKACHLVPRKKFNSACEELEAALKREQQAQLLLKELSGQLQQLSSQVDQQASHGVEKDETLSEAVKELSEVKMDLKRKEQMVRQLNRQVDLLEKQRAGLQENMRDAERALKTAAKDKDSLSSYLRAVCKALDKFAIEVGCSPAKELPNPAVLLSPDLLPKDHGKAGPELASCQVLVNSFTSVVKQTYRRLDQLTGEMDSQRQHIQILKIELEAACKRQEDSQSLHIQEAEKGGKQDEKWYTQQMEPPVKDTFKPLQEDTSMSASTSPVKQAKQGPLNTSTPQSKRHQAKTGEK